MMASGAGGRDFITLVPICHLPTSSQMFLVAEAVVQAPYPSSTPMLDSWLYFQPAKVLLVSVVSSQTEPASSEKATNLAP